MTDLLSLCSHTNSRSATFSRCSHIVTGGDVREAELCSNDKINPFSGSPDWDLGFIHKLSNLLSLLCDWFDMAGSMFHGFRAGEEGTLGNDVTPTV